MTTYSRDSLIDLRSDTVTKPTPAMLKAMIEAEVGDDVFGEDPTARALEEQVADLLGKEAALFVPSGTMANQIGVAVHTHPGDELLCSTTSHVYVWEGGGVARLSGVTARTFDGDRGLLRLEDLEGKIRPNDGHYVQTRLVCLENTHNRGGGRIAPLDETRKIAQWAKTHGLAMHLDGARLMNAVIATKIPAAEWAAPFDTVSICFSKGLGTPAGSAIVGSQDLIKKAHRLRKLFGGGMRQVGILAAAAIHALNHHVERLAEDHENAQLIAQAVRDNPLLKLEFDPVETNLVWIEVSPQLGTAAQVVANLREQGVLPIALGPQMLRACTHLNVTRQQAQHAANCFRELK